MTANPAMRGATVVSDGGACRTTSVTNFIPRFGNTPVWRTQPPRTPTSGGSRTSKGKRCGEHSLMPRANSGARNARQPGRGVLQFHPRRPSLRRRHNRGCEHADCRDLSWRTAGDRHVARLPPHQNRLDGGQRGGRGAEHSQPSGRGAIWSRAHAAGQGVRCTRAQTRSWRVWQCLRPGACGSCFDRARRSRQSKKKAPEQVKG
jgi:hypothetical protein